MIRRIRQVMALATLAIAAGLIMLGVIRVGGLVIAAQTAVATEPPIAAPSELPLPNASWAPGVEVPASLPGGGDAVLRGYGQAWDELEKAQATLRTDRLDRFFDGAALRRLRDALDEVESPVVVRDDAHTLELAYVHPEGWLVSFVDRDAAVTREVAGRAITSRETYQVTMILDGGRWLVRSIVRSGAR